MSHCIFDLGKPTKRLLIAFLLFFCHHITFGQIRISDNGTSVQPYFTIGTKRSYKAEINTKVESSPLYPFNCSTDFTVSFEVLDTAKGYTVGMHIALDTVFEKHMEFEAIKAHILDGTTVDLRISRDGKTFSIRNADLLRERFNNALDYYTFGKG